MKVAARGLPRYETARLRLLLVLGPVEVEVDTTRPAKADVRLSQLASAVTDLATMTRTAPTVAVFHPHRGDAAPVREPRRPRSPREIGRHAASLPVPCPA